MGIGKVPGLKWKTGMVYGHISAPECCRADMGTGMVSGPILAPNGAQAPMSTVNVPGHLCAPE